MPFVLCKDDMNGTLKGCRGVCKADRHTNVLMSSQMWKKRCLRSIFSLHIHLPVARVRIKDREHIRLSE